MKSLPGRIFIVIIYGALSITQLQWTKSISILSLLIEMIISCSMQFYEPRLRYSSALCPKWLFELTVVIHWRIIQCKSQYFLDSFWDEARRVVPQSFPRQYSWIKDLKWRMDLPLWKNYLADIYHFSLFCYDGYLEDFSIPWDVCKNACICT